MMSRGLRILIGLAAAVIVLGGLRSASAIVGPAFLALTLTIAVSPLRSWLKRRGAPPWVLMTVPLLVVLLVLLAFVASLVVSVAQLASLLPAYTDEYNAMVTGVTRWLATLGITTDQISAAVKALDPSKLVPLVQGFLSSLLGVVSAFVLILLLVYGMSLDAGPMQAAIRKLEDTRPEVVRALTHFTKSTCRYLIVSTIFGLIVAVLDAGALWLLGVPLPLLWGLLAFITNYIPNIGFILGLVPPALLALLDSGWITMLWVIVVYCVLNFVIQSVIQPKYAGESAGLSITVTMLSLLVWSVVLGALGAILAVPLSALARALLVDADPGTRWAIPLVSGEAREERPTRRGGRSDTRRSSG
ncbi:AI-2E family transporter [Nonomuraea sp. NPDC059194]|uniref:AI-2E family transporter n=1 Tax=Nonomuraea sp. NPDC059194 TaxID=3346764 RepID=UPI0036985E05